MSEFTLLLEPRDPVLVRDGRPFTAEAGASAVSLPWPLPSTVAGALRAHIGERSGFDWKTDGPQRAREIEVAGPLMLVGREDGEWQVFLHAPLDAVLYRETVVSPMRLSPLTGLPGESGCNMPAGSLVPLSVTEDVKPEAGYDYWSLADCVNWLCGEDAVPRDYLERLPVDTRVHVSVAGDTGTAEEGMLFSTVSLSMNDVCCMWNGHAERVAMLCRVSSADAKGADGSAFIPFGGERRMSCVSPAGDRRIPWPEMPDKLKSACKGAKRLKLQLVTPAIFSGGWRPGWLDGAEMPSLPGVKVKMISAVTGRKAPVSGWNMDGSNGRKPGPKPARYMVPAGSVLFLELDSELDGKALDSLWLASVCDDPQDRLDGFGLAVPGVWNYSDFGGGK